MKRLFQTCFLSLILVIGISAAAFAYDKPYIGDEIEYRAEYVDTFVHLARDYNLGFVEMRAANPGIDPWIPGEGTKLTLPTRHILPGDTREGIVINIAEMRLFYFKDGDEEPISFPIGVGREGLDTPLGTTTIQRKTDGPTWYPTARMRKEDPELPAYVPPGPENPLGTHALYLGWPTYAIHGTNRPFGIGRRISSGCIRLYPEDIKDLFAQVPVGTKVTVVDEDIKTAWIDDKLYIEAHADRDQALELEETGRISDAKLSKEDIVEIIKAAGPEAKQINWNEIHQIIHERRGYPIEIARRTSRPDEALTNSESGPDLPLEKQAQVIFDRLMNGGKEDAKAASVTEEDETEKAEDEKQPRKVSYDETRETFNYERLNP